MNLENESGVAFVKYTCAIMGKRAVKTVDDIRSLRNFRERLRKGKR